MRIHLLLSVLVIAACASPRTPQVASATAARFGMSVRSALQAQVIDPDAAAHAQSSLGLDGKAVHEALGLYQGSFKAPPPVTNVINIGGAVGAK